MKTLPLVLAVVLMNGATLLALRQGPMAIVLLRYGLKVCLFVPILSRRRVQVVVAELTLLCPMLLRMHSFRRPVHL